METRRYSIGNMDCPGCAREVETAVGKLDGVRLARVDYISNSMQLVGDVEFVRLKARVEALGKTISQPESKSDIDSDRSKRAGVAGFWDYLRAKPASRLALAGGALLLMAITTDLTRVLPSRFSDIVYVLAMLVAMKPIAQSAISALRINREFNINMLMSIAAFGALLLGEYLEAATVIFLFAIGEALEGYTADRARSSLHSLLAMKPARAQRVLGDRVEDVAVEDLRIDDHIRVLPASASPWTAKSSSARAPLIKPTLRARASRSPKGPAPMSTPAQSTARERSRYA